MSWARAYVWAAGVFAYFAIATVWIPSFVVGQTTDESVRDFVATGLWLAGFVAGIWALRRLQDRGSL